MVALESIPLFRHLGPEELQALRRVAQERRFSAGNEIFRENDDGDGVYFVKDGLIEIGGETGRGAIFSFVLSWPNNFHPINR